MRGTYDGEHLKDYVDHYVRLAKDGELDDVYHSLIDAGAAAVPLLWEAYEREADPDVRVLFVEVIWEMRDEAVIPLLAQALEDEAKEVWKAALYGLVTIACPESCRVLEDAIGRAAERKRDGGLFREWAQEALEQTREQMAAGT